MAVGTPSKITESKSDKVELVYPNKESSLSILNQHRSELISLLSNESKNQLYFGDNLEVLLCLLDNPKINKKVNLIYIDPPFATQSHFSSRNQKYAYSDVLSGANFIEYLRKRLIILRELLSDEGSIYLHLDDKMVFEMKIIMDEIFGANNYRNLIVRKKCNPKNYTRKSYGNITDFILFYTKSDNYIWNKPVTDISDKSLKEYRYIEENTGRRYMKVPIHAPGIRNGETGKEWRGMLPPIGKHWQYKPSTLDEMDARGEIFWSENGNPRRKVYLDEHTGVGVQDIWLDYKDAHNQNIKITGYPTEKNPELLERIIKTSSNEGDLILDCFAGSGTTLDVSSKLNRYWIGVDKSIESIKTILDRLSNGTKPMGDFVSKINNSAQSTIFDLFDKQDSFSEKIENEFKRNINFSVFALSGKRDEISYLFDSASSE
jgi:adenine-specific DNA-methyltransferase